MKILLPILFIGLIVWIMIDIGKYDATHKNDDDEYDDIGFS